MPNTIRKYLPSALLGFLLATSAVAQTPEDDPPGRQGIRDTIEADPDTERVSPVRRIRRNSIITTPQLFAPLDEPAFDGYENNLNEPSMNAAHELLARWLPSAYADGVAALAGADRPNPRVISNGIFAQSESRPNEAGLTDFFWQWGQFLDHDIDLTDGVDPAEPADIAIPVGDAFFDPLATGDAVLPFNRSLYDRDTGTGVSNPRQQINEITGWIDGSQIYGSDMDRADRLRTHDGTGRMRMSRNRLLPLESPDDDNAGGNTPGMFLAGDIRANEQVGLTAMHTLFVREHNRLAERLGQRTPGLSGEEIYQRSRALVTAQLQVITYREFLPRLLGVGAIPPYEGYDPNVDARIMNSFSTAAFRFGHSLLSPQLLRLNADGTEHESGHLALRAAFFAPHELIDHGIEPILRGLAEQVCQQLDAQVIDDVRNFLFGRPGAGGFDLVALNIQRGRDHGLPSYNAARVAAGLDPVTSFDDISRDESLREQLRETYGTVSALDLWVGGLAEDHLSGAQVGPLFHAMLVRQFTALRDGDRFWYENRFGPDTVRSLEETRLAHVIRRNTRIAEELPSDVFVAGLEASTPTRGPSGRDLENRR